MTLQFTGYECENAADALGWIDASGRGVAISIGNKVLVVEQAEADRIAAMGIAFAYLFDHEMPDGTHHILSVPVND